MSEKQAVRCDICGTVVEMEVRLDVKPWRELAAGWRALEVCPACAALLPAPQPVAS